MTPEHKALVEALTRKAETDGLLSVEDIRSVAESLSPQPANPAQVTDAMVDAIKTKWAAMRRLGDPNEHALASAAIAAIGAGGQAVARPVAWQNIETPSSILTPDQYEMRLPLAKGRFLPLYTHPAPSGQAVAVKPLDLSNLLKHAFSAGYVSAAGDDEWTDYDPTKCAAYVRILSALSQPHPADERVVAALAQEGRNG